MTTAAETLANHLTGAQISRPSDDVLDEARACVIDSVGVALVGSRTPWAQAGIRASLAEGGNCGTAHVIGTSSMASPAMAALANGTSGHSLDFDDDNAQVHAGAAVIATVFALGESLGSNGRDLLRAVIVGYEAAVRTAWAFDPDQLYARGFHPTGIGNTFGCTAAAGALHGLDAEQMRNALGIAGSMAGGLLEFYTDGSMTKRLHAGHPAYCGVMASRLAAEGFTGPSTVFEGPFGALEAYSGAPKLQALTSALDGPPKILDTARKYYPMNFSTHGAIDLIRAIRQREGLTAHDVRSIRVAIRPFVAPAVGADNKYRPATVLAAQMSMPFAVAVALVDGRVTLDHLTEEGIADGGLLAHADKVTTAPDASLDEVEGVEAGSVLPTRIRVETVDGRVFEEMLTFQRGDPRNPLSSDDLRDKFVDCAGRVLGRERAHEALAALDEIDTWTDPGSFMQAIRN